MSSNALIIQGVGIVVAVACALPGVFWYCAGQRWLVMPSATLFYSVLWLGC